MLLLSSAALAQDFTWTTNSPDTNTVTLTGYTGAGGDVVIPSNIEGRVVTIIGDSVCRSDLNLTSILIPNSVIRIEDWSFCSCRNLTNITFGTGLSSIGMYAFSWCHALTDIQLPENLEMTGIWSFYYCDELKTVSVPESLETIGLGNFFYCKNLTSIAVDTNNPAYCSVDGVLFDKAITTLVLCPGGITGSYVVPDGVAVIGPESFCHNLTSVILPSSVYEIRMQAFEHCLALSNVYFCGNSPMPAEISAFPDISTIYYLSGSMGWGPTYGERPTALWLPEVQAEGMGVQSQAFGFNIAWADGQSVVVEACTNLTDPVWVPLATHTIVEGTAPFSDSAWTNTPGRFYRLR